MIQTLRLDPLVFTAVVHPQHVRAAVSRCLIDRSGAYSSLKQGHTGVPNANNTTADPQTAPAESKTSKVYAPAGMSAEAWRMYTCIYNDT